MGIEVLTYVTLLIYIFLNLFLAWERGVVINLKERIFLVSGACLMFRWISLATLSVDKCHWSLSSVVTVPSSCLLHPSLRQLLALAFRDTTLLPVFLLLPDTCNCVSCENFNVVSLDHRLMSLVWISPAGSGSWDEISWHWHSETGGCWVQASDTVAFLTTVSFLSTILLSTCL